MGLGRAPVPPLCLSQTFNSALRNIFVYPWFCFYKAIGVWKCSSAASNTTHVPLLSPLPLQDAPVVCPFCLLQDTRRGAACGQHGWAARQAARGWHRRNLQWDHSILQVKDHRQQYGLKSRAALSEILVTSEQERTQWTSIVWCCFVKLRAEKHSFYTSLRACIGLGSAVPTQYSSALIFLMTEDDL